MPDREVAEFLAIMACSSAVVVSGILAMVMNKVRGWQFNRGYLKWYLRQRLLEGK